ncbi:IS30 family transposase, partial [Streptococcus dysgalactiae]|uniref:IS30 family transposase n=2 Tax=Streptococcus dysgalactiae TaxID=1334 RepID=UPI000A23D66B
EYINDRSEFGHWEIDLILGKKTKGEALMLTLVERQTRYALGVKLEDKQSQTVNRAVTHLISQYPIASITADNGSEFSLLSNLEAVDVYFAHPYSSHERGTNENFNGLLREYVPKGTKTTTPKEVAAIEHWINHYPKRLFNYKSPVEMLKLANFNLKFGDELK